jgi:hypothetical protein
MEICLQKQQNQLQHVKKLQAKEKYVVLVNVHKTK